MDIEHLDREHLRDAQNILLLANLSPSGTSAYTELFAHVCPADARAVVVTYTQPPDLWLADWDRLGRERPRELVFVHGGPSPGDDISTEDATITSLSVDPSEPMDIVTAVTDSLDREPGIPAVVSVQSLTVLLEYVDFDTAFRYLHVLLHRARGSDALGVYQMDPRIHGPETVNTLSVLFDLVVEAELTDGNEVEWSVITAKTEDDDALQIPTDSPSLRIRDWISTTFTRIVARVRRLVIARGTSHDPEYPDSDLKEPTPSREVHRDEGQPLLTDEERIRRLLLDAGGRMSQADIVESTDWSGPTVSRKLSKMEEDGLISRVQVGRGNLVFLDGHQPDITGSSRLEPDDR